MQYLLRLHINDVTQKGIEVNRISNQMVFYKQNVLQKLIAIRSNATSITTYTNPK